MSIWVKGWRKSRSPIGVGDTQSEKNHVAHVPEDGFQHILPALFGIELPEDLVGESQAQAEFSRFAKHRRHVVRHEVLEFINVDVDRFAFDFGSQASLESRREKFHHQDSAQKPAFNGSEQAFVQVEQHDFLTVHPARRA